MGRWRAAEKVRGSRELAGHLKALFQEVPLATSLALILLAGLGVVEGAVILLLVPILAHLGIDAGSGALGWAARSLDAVVARMGGSSGLTLAASAFVVAAVLRAFLLHRQTVLHLSLHHRLVASLRRRLFRAITSASWLFLSRHRSSDFNHLLTTEVERVGAATFHLLGLLVSGMGAALHLGLALALSAPMTLIVLLCGAVLWLSARPRLRAARAAGEELTRTSQELHARAAHHLEGLKAAKLHGAEGRQAAVFDALGEHLRFLHLRAVREQAGAKLRFDLGAALVASLTLLLSQGALAIPIADLLLLLVLFSRLLPRASSLQQAYQSFVHLAPAHASVLAMEARCRAAAEPRGGDEEAPAFRNEIRLERVRFSYGRRPVLHGLDLTIPAGWTVALVGASGAGKSTAADVLLGLLEPERGRVLVDGKPLRPSWLPSFRERIGHVGQDAYLFHDTIRANLLWGKPGAGEEEILEALGRAAAREFVQALPRGLDTVVGERGVQLSGGERQRLALARALLRRPQLLVLDEPTSQLDEENEARIIRAVEGLHGSLTILVITHRLSLARGADLVHVLDGGRVVESGMPEEILARPRDRLRSADRAGSRGRGR